MCLVFDLVILLARTGTSTAFWFTLNIIFVSNIASLIRLIIRIDSSVIYLDTLYRPFYYFCQFFYYCNHKLAQQRSWTVIQVTPLLKPSTLKISIIFRTTIKKPIFMSFIWTYFQKMTISLKYNLPLAYGSS
jgi:hypothetical protein